MHNVSLIPLSAFNLYFHLTHVRLILPCLSSGKAGSKREGRVGMLYLQLLGLLRVVPHPMQCQGAHNHSMLLPPLHLHASWGILRIEVHAS